MTTATATRPATRRPRTAKKIKPAPVVIPTCRQCHKELSRRDYDYGAKGSNMCKTCHQKAERKRLHGVYVPAARMPHATMAYGTERTAKLTAQPAWRTARKKTATPANDKPAGWMRAKVRAERNIRRKARKESAA